MLPLAALASCTRGARPAGTSVVEPGQDDPSLIRPPSPTPSPIPTATPMPATATAIARARLTPTPAGTAGAAPAPPTIARPAQFTWALEADPVSLDAHQQTNFSSTLAYEHIYESLTAFDDKLNIVPSLASAWELGKDGLWYTFHLDGAARFQEGPEVSAEDVRWSFARILAPENHSP
ncbi:MAG TPA: ABC transporter substrate-binding protein, partial [Chloroflexota bacterium]